MVRELQRGAGDAEYLEALSGALEQAFEQFLPDLVIYNAGTDILAGEPGGVLGVLGPQQWAAQLSVCASRPADLAVCSPAECPTAMLVQHAMSAAAGDPLGRLQVSQEAVVRRDEMVWQAALDHK